MPLGSIFCTIEWDLERNFVKVNRFGALRWWSVCITWTIVNDELGGCNFNNAIAIFIANGVIRARALPDRLLVRVQHCQAKFVGTSALVMACIAILEISRNWLFANHIHVYKRIKISHSVLFSSPRWLRAWFKLRFGFVTVKTFNECFFQVGEINVILKKNKVHVYKLFFYLIESHIHVKLLRFRIRRCDIVHSHMIFVSN